MGLQEQLIFNVEKGASQISNFIRESVKNFGARGVILGLSGGLDSACVCGLAARAIDPSKVLALLMPERDSDPKSEQDAKLVANMYGVKAMKIDLTSILSAFGVYKILPKDTFSKREKVAKLVKLGYSLFPKNHSPFIGGIQETRFKWQREVQAYYRIKHRLRMVALYYYGEQLNYLVLGCANRTEHLIGFFVKYGDDSADIMPIINLYKTQVRKLSKFIHVPDSIIQKAPTPDLLPGIEDEYAIGMNYEKLDLILSGLTNGTGDKDIANELQISGRTLTYIKNIVKLSEPMRNIAEGPKVRKPV